MITKIKLSDIVVGDRMRVDYGDVVDLANSINAYGLIQPIVLNNKNELVAGGRRLAAVTSLGWTEVPFVYFDDQASEVIKVIAELEENYRRKDMTWQEQVQCVAKVHELNNRQRVLVGETWTLKHTGAMLGIAYGKVQYSLMIAERLKSEPEGPVAKAGSLKDALAILAGEREREAAQLLTSMSAKVSYAAAEPGATLSLDSLMESIDLTPEAPMTSDKVAALVEQTEIKAQKEAESPKTQSAPVRELKVVEVNLNEFLFPGDCRDVMRSMPDESVGHIITDPPYAEDMAMLQQTNTGMNIDMTRAEHQVEENLALLDWFCANAARVLKPTGFLAMWCDQMVWQRLYDNLTLAGLRVQRWPYVWVKEHPCMNQAAAFNFTKATEICIIASKPQARMKLQGVINYHRGSFSATERDEKKHPFAKPHGLWQKLFQALCNKGDTVLDPFAGSGSSCISAYMCGLKPIGIEKVPEHYVVMEKELCELMTRLTFGQVRLNFVRK